MPDIPTTTLFRCIDNLKEIEDIGPDSDELRVRVIEALKKHAPQKRYEIDPDTEILEGKDDTYVTFRRSSGKSLRVPIRFVRERTP